MGNVSSVREGSREEVGKGGSRELMGEQSPPESPSGAASSPLLFTPQVSCVFCVELEHDMMWGLDYTVVTVPLAPLHQLDEANLLNHISRQDWTEYEDMSPGQCIPTMITWSHGGKEVAVHGSWDNWKTKEPLQRSGKDFNILKVLPSGVYQYKFLVDGEWRYSPDLPWVHDEWGNACNVLDLQDFIPDGIENVTGFEPPQSPESSYNNWPLGSEDFSKEPPMVPPQLHVTLLNTPSFVDNPYSLSRPQQVVLNHLYIQKSKNTQPLVALGVTHRFLSKFVTVVLYKSFQK